MKSKMADLKATFDVKGAVTGWHAQNSRVQNTFYSDGNLQILVQFDKNYKASVMKLKKSFIIVIPPGAQDSNLKKSAWFFQVLPPWQCPFKYRQTNRNYVTL